MELKPLKPLLRGNFNCDFLGEICEGAVRKDEAVQWRSSGGGHWSLLGTSRKVLCCSRKITLLQQQRDTMYSAVVRVGFNRWLLLLLPGFRIPELNWSLQHCALLSTGAGTLHCTNWSPPTYCTAPTLNCQLEPIYKVQVQCLVAHCQVSGAVEQFSGARRKPFHISVKFQLQPFTSLCFTL